MSERNSIEVPATPSPSVAPGEGMQQAAGGGRPRACARHVDPVHAVRRWRLVAHIRRDRRYVLRSLLVKAPPLVVVGLVVLIGLFYGFLYLTALL